MEGDQTAKTIYSVSGGWVWNCAPATTVRGGNNSGVSRRGLFRELHQRDVQDPGDRDAVHCGRCLSGGGIANAARVHVYGSEQYRIFQLVAAPTRE